MYFQDILWLKLRGTFGWRIRALNFWAYINSISTNGFMMVKNLFANLFSCSVTFVCLSGVTYVNEEEEELIRGKLHHQAMKMDEEEKSSFDLEVRFIEFLSFRCADFPKTWSLKKNKKQKKKKLLEQKGLKAIMDKIVELKKPLIGHNMSLDVMNLFQAFFKDLPATLDEFKSELTKRLPMSIFHTLLCCSVEKLILWF